MTAVQHPRVLPDHLAGLVAVEAAERWVDIADHPVEVLHPDRVGGLFDGGSEPRPFLVGCQPLRDVLDDRHEDRRCLVGQEVDAHLHGVRGSILAAVDRLEGDLVALTGHQRSDQGIVRCSRERWLEVHGRQLAQLVHRVPQVATQAGIRLGEPQGLRVDDVDLARQLIEQPGEPRLLLLELHPLSDVLRRAGVPDRAAGRVANDDTDLVEDPHGAVRPDDPVLGFTGGAPRECLRAGGRLHAVVGVDECEVRFERPRERAWLDPEDPARLVGPAERACRDVPFPAPDVGDSLRLGEVAACRLQLVTAASIADRDRGMGSE